jgi:hypothetical protein
MKANWLLSNGKNTQKECSKMFLDGLHVDFRNQVKHQLRIFQPWTVTQIEEAAKFLLQNQVYMSPAYSPAGQPMTQPPFTTYEQPGPTLQTLYSTYPQPGYPTHPVYLSQVPPQPRIQLQFLEKLLICQPCSISWHL